jgi:hypothetical protein
MLTTHHERAFDHVGDYGDALGSAQNGIWDARIACGHLLDDLGCLIHFRCGCVILLRPAHGSRQGHNAQY